MTEIRCICCRKLLGKIPKQTKAKIEIKCPKCKTIHVYDTEALEAQG